jgi:hypothetical protein
MPGGELFDGGSDNRCRDGIEFGCKPGLEAREVFIAWGQNTVVLEQAAQVGDLCLVPLCPDRRG